MTEKESLLVLNQEIKSDLSFCRDCAVSQGATGWVKDFDRLLDKNEILNNKLNQQFSSRSKLSIPKKIAELLDIGYAYEGDEERDHSWLIHNMDDFTSPESYCKFYSWLEDSKDNYSLAITYLAGKALGVELVEVEE